MVTRISSAGFRQLHQSSGEARNDADEMRQAIGQGEQYVIGGVWRREAGEGASR